MGTLPTVTLSLPENPLKKWWSVGLGNKVALVSCISLENVIKLQTLCLPPKS
jgi:hypothetical protein